MKLCSHFKMFRRWFSNSGSPIRYEPLLHQTMDMRWTTTPRMHLSDKQISLSWFIQHILAQTSDLRPQGSGPGSSGPSDRSELVVETRCWVRGWGWSWSSDLLHADSTAADFISYFPWVPAIEPASWFPVKQQRAVRTSRWSSPVQTWGLKRGCCRIQAEQTWHKKNILELRRINVSFICL